MKDGFELRAISKHYGKQAILSDISLELPRGQHTAVLGPSGCGKSTLLRLLAGLESPDTGEVHLDGALASAVERIVIPPHQRAIGMVFQDLALWPNLTALDNVRLGETTNKAAHDALALCGIEELANRRPGELSGGQQQRVAIARSLAMQPVVMLFDEVTSALDPELTEEVLAAIEDLAAQGMTMILVTHEMRFARRVADRTIYMRDGIIHEQGPSDSLFAEPQTSELRSFLKAELGQ